MTSISPPPALPRQPGHPAPPASPPPARVDPALAASAAALLSALVREEPLAPDTWAAGAATATWAGAAVAAEQVRRRGVFGRR